MFMTNEEVLTLSSLYENRKVFHGELHDHSQSGGTSDGQRALAEWPGMLKEKEMDFAAILDHRQIRHMYLPEWEDGLFIPGTEPGTSISDLECENNGMHYNILLPHRDELEKLLNEFPEYAFTGGTEGHFIYPSFTKARFGELIDAVLARGGFFVHPHPKQVMKSENALDYWFRDKTGIEVFYNDYDSKYTDANYPLWVELLSLGKRVYACAGGDYHNHATDRALTTIYAEEKSAKAFMPHLRNGDFTCGQCGIRMCIGNTVMGGETDFNGKRLLAAIDDFHKSVKRKDHTFRADLFFGGERAYSFPVSCETPNHIAIDLKNAPFCRVEVVDETENRIIAVGNPIWNTGK